jgi:multiple sugar transport system substrate-binding protein
VPEIEISVNNSYVDPVEVIQPLLTRFEQEHHRAHVAMVVYDWSIAWTELMKISLYQHGPVISQAGNSWMGSMISQNSLRTFKSAEIAQYNQEQHFLPGSWQSCLDFDNRQVVAIPWILDAYLVYYRRSALKKAGIDEANAFSTLENLHSTLERLQKNGQQYPFVVPTNPSRSNIHNVASWVWEMGGDFTNPDGTSVTLSSPETRRGLKMYFDLYRFISPVAQELNDVDCWNWFVEGKAAVTVRNPEILFRLSRGELPAGFAEDVGTAAMPGVPFLGGSNLVMWKHLPSEIEEDAVNLVKFLASADAGLSLFEHSGLLPASLEALERIPADSAFAPVIQSVRKARPFPRIRMWGLIEDKLAVGLSQIWNTLLSTPNPQVEQIIAAQFDPLEKRLNITLSQ